MDRLKLEVEKKKALVELGKIDPVSAGRADALPSLMLRYVFLSSGRKEALLEVNGIECRVREGDDVNGKSVKAISAEGVMLKDKDGREWLLRSGSPG